MYRVAIVEDDPRFRVTVETVLEATPGFHVAASFGAAEDALAASAAALWDLVLMDVELPGMTGIEALRILKRDRADLQVVVLTVFEDPGTILEAICAGADGYLLKGTPFPEFVAQLQAVGRGGSPLSSPVARKVLDLVRIAEASPRRASAVRGLLSPREHDVLRGLVDGLSYKQVAAELGISIDTVRSYVRTLYRKLQVHSVAEAVGRALREGLV